MSKGEDRVLSAIDVIQAHIRKDYIVDGCREERVAGCVSCAMIRLDEDLDMLRYEIESNMLGDHSSPIRAKP